MVERLVANEKVVGSSPIARSILSIMSDLAEKKCIPCEGGIPSFKIDEIHKYLKKVDGWDVKPDESKNYYLIKEFKFKNFLEMPFIKPTISSEVALDIKSSKFTYFPFGITKA